MKKLTIVLVLSALAVSACSESSNEDNHQCDPETELCDTGDITQCTNDTWKCDGNTLSKCVSGKWEINQTCAANTLCNAQTGSCVPNGVPQCTNNTWRCDGNTLSKCVSGKWIISQTCAANTRCNTQTGSCVPNGEPQCTNNTWKCDENTLSKCVSNKWIISQACAANTRCNAEKGLCEPNKSECRDTEHFFAGQCEADDVTHCGTHTNDCTKTSGWKDGKCIAKQCFAEECKTGYHLASIFDSDNIERTFCEEDTHDACGSINTKCRAEEICTQGKCTDKCQPGEVSCNGSCINPMESQNFCGADVSCSSYIPCSEFEKCIEGKCVQSSCQNAEESLCTSDDQTICIDIHGNHPNHCGACGAVCSDKETAKAAGCSHGQCIYTCKNGAVNCGSDTEPLCLPEEQLKSDPLHCGKCDTSCKANELCQNGQCIISACTGNECFYNNACVNEDTHCGTQCLNCNTSNHASAGICQGGSCVITSCIAGYHLTNEGTCEMDSAKACPNGQASGTVNCNTLDYTETGICEEGICKATECKDNAHIKENKCVTDTIEACGSEDNDCTQIAGWEAGTCENGKCIATTCQSGFCLNSLSGQCTSTQNNSTCGIDGGACLSCNQKQVCTNGVCANKQCNGNVCNQTKDSDETLVCKNDDIHCGSNCLDCNTFTPNAVSGKCSIANGTCTVTQCDNGFHLYNNSCEKDDTNNCGVHDNPCDADSSCIDGSCQKECLTFTEPEIGNYAFANWDTNHNGCISRSEAEAVTEIPEKAFYNNTSLISLSDLEQFPNLKTIGDSAFEGCSGLTAVSLPQATHIGDSAFSGCMNIVSIDLPQATHIGDRAFVSGVNEYYEHRVYNTWTECLISGCQITGEGESGSDGTIRETIENTNLTSISLPKATYIGAEAFSGCTSLTSIDLPEATEIGNYAFVGGKSVYNYQTYYKFDGFYYDDDSTNGIEIRIKKNAGLTAVNLPKATHIGKGAFSGCTGLTSIDLPQAIYIGDFAFVGGTSEDYNYDYNENIINIIEMNTSLISVSLPKVTEIGNYAFSGCTSLTTIDLPQATEIGGSAFKGCTSLTTIDLPQATKIPDHAFLGCTGLTSIDLPQVTSIGSNAFSGCTSLTSIDLPQATTVEDYAFSGCTGLTSIDLPQATTVEDYAFSGCTGLTSIDLPQAIEIGTKTFSGCTSLTSIDLPQATSIGNYAFSGSTNLISLVLTSSAKITLTNYSLAPFYYHDFYGWEETLPLYLDKVTLTLHQNKAVGGSSSPLCTSATEWGGKTWKEIKFVK